MTAFAMHRTSAGRRLLTGYVWLVLAVMLAPTLALVPLSFSGEASLVLPPKSFSWQWYSTLLHDPSWRGSAELSLKVAIVVAITTCMIGSLAAVGLARGRGRLVGLLRLVFIAPLIVPVMVLAIAVYFEFARLRLLGSFWSLVLAYTVLTLPLVIVTVSARVVSIDPTLERAAASSGAGPFRTFRSVLLPLLAPAIAVGGALAFVTSFDEVVIALFLSGPRLETLPLRMWEGITVGGLNNTITAVTTIELALAVAAFCAFELVLTVRRRRLAGTDIGGPQKLIVERRAADARRLRPDRDRSEASIEFRRVTKRYADQVAVDDVSLLVEPGEFVTLLGPSGSGKTTLLSMVAGFIEPDEGTILIDGRSIVNVSPHRRDIGFVFQNYALFPHLNVRENVTFPLRLRHIPRRVARARADAALNLIDLSGYGDRAVSQLSGGQQQRVAFARAVVFEPRVLLMDEPLGALDRNLRLQMQLEIKQLHRELRQTTIYVTHDQEEALNLSDRIAVLSHGRLQQLGTPEELYRRPANAFVATFFGEANVFSGEARDGVFVADGGVRFAVDSGPRGRGFVAVRPESIRVAGDEAGQHAVRGVVTDRTFQGRVVRIVVDCGGHIVRTVQNSTAGVRLPNPGDRVGVDWSVEDAQFMPEETA